MMNAPGRIVFVTGTDTGVGKTIISAALIRRLVRTGIRACGFKPVESGVQPGERTDSQILARAAGWGADRDAGLYRLIEPAAPAVAARAEGVEIDVSRIRMRCNELQQQYEILIVEGAGGLLVPISREYLVADLISDLDCDVIVVARADLGTINHSLLTTEALRRRGIEPLAIVLNRGSAESTLAERTNPGEIRGLSRVDPVIVVPEIDDSDAMRIAERAGEYVQPILSKVQHAMAG